MEICEEEMRNLIVLVFLVILTFFATGCGQQSGVTVSHPDYQGQIDDINNRLDDLTDRVAVFEMDLGNLESSVIQLGNDLDNFEHDLDQVEINVTDALNRISQLEGNTYIADIVKPCANAKEVLVVLSDGRIVAYFEQGNKRYLSLLGDGNYQTTDGTNCHFSIPLQ